MWKIFGCDWRICLVFWVLASLGGCHWLTTPEPGVGQPVDWSDLPGWMTDQQQEAWPALLAQCPRMRKKSPLWPDICDAAARLPQPDRQQVRAFMQRYFQPYELIGKKGHREGLITGYYQPVLNGRRTPSPRYRYPLYSRPDDLLVIDLGALYPELKGKRVRGRLEGHKVVPYFDRAQIDGQDKPLKGHEILWVDDPYGSFFLQIQGSGKIRLPDGAMVAVSYADQNGHPYHAIGKTLIEQGALSRESVSLFTIRDWLRQHPDQAMALLNKNPSYVFFTLREDARENPRGSLNVPLTNERSVAVDRKIIPLGSPIWMDSRLPGSGKPYQRLMFAQDTGGAITGPVRADVFFGTGKTAEQLAGTMKQPGKLYILLPRAAI